MTQITVGQMRIISLSDAPELRKFYPRTLKRILVNILSTDELRNTCVVSDGPNTFTIPIELIHTPYSTNRSAAKLLDKED